MKLSEGEVALAFRAHCSGNDIHPVSSTQGRAVVNAAFPIAADVAVPPGAVPVHR